VVLFATLFSVTAYAYGPRDHMSYPHPAQKPAEGSACVTGIQRVEAYGPRQTGPNWFCPSERGGDDGSVRIDYSGPRPRAILNQ
jgi:hypothetical protein